MDNQQNFISRLLKDAKNNTTLHASMNEVYFYDLYQHMLKFAQNQLNDSEWAQDAVQECLICAMECCHEFKGNSAFKSWVFAILKHKISDILRKNQKYITLSELTDETQDESWVDMLFCEDGHWNQNYAPNAFNDSWSDPQKQTENKYFWQVLEYCLEHLPGDQARVFLMKEYIGLDTKEICGNLKISSQNYYVLMHRARLQLQLCLNRHWFND